MDIPSLTIDRVRQALLSREFTASELAAAALRFAETENPKTNAYLHLCPERAMAAAGRVDERIARGEDPDFAGGEFPLTENFDHLRAHRTDADQTDLVLLHFLTFFLLEKCGVVYSKRRESAIAF